MDVRINITELLRRYHIEIDGCYVGNLGRKYNEDDITALLLKAYEIGFSEGLDEGLEKQDAWRKGYIEGLNDVITGIR